jgi:hypothetical protein
MVELYPHVSICLQRIVEGKAVPVLIKHYAMKAHGGVDV